MAVTLPPAMSTSTGVWDAVMEMTKSAQSKGTDPSIWAVQLSSTLLAAGIATPSTEVAELLVSHICWSNNVPIAWKYLEKAIAVRIAPPMLVLALLSNSVIPSRRSQPAAYRLYLELLKRHVFSLSYQVNSPNYRKIMEFINNALNLSQRFGILSSEPGLLLVEFVFAIVWHLLDVSLDDESLLELVPEKKSIWPIKPKDMEIDDHNILEKKITHNDRLYKINTTLAIEIIVELFRNKLTSRILYLARQNMPKHWGSFIYNMKLLAENSISLRNSKDFTREDFLQLISDNNVQLSPTISLQQFHTVMASGPNHGTNRSAIWLPIDLFFEDIMEGAIVSTTSAAETLTGLLKAHRAITQASWQDAFLGLWIAVLRLVQREGDAVEGPIPRLDTCLCLLLCTTTLAIVNIVDEEDHDFTEENEKQTQIIGNCCKSLISSLQQLGDFEGLLTPPPSVTCLASQAAAKAVMFFNGLAVGNGVSLNDMPVTCSGDLRHLIVEACIARNLLDTSAYLWPGYIKGHTNQVSPQPISGQLAGWSSLMKGSPLTPSMVHTLVSTPASSLAEIEKIYGIATDGSDADKISAATILCGASLIRGWNIQEHTGSFIIKLLSPSVPPDYTETDSHLLTCAPLLNVLLVGISSIDCVQIFSLLGLVPQLAGVLMPICEVFGSCSPTVSWSLPSGTTRLCPLSVFSDAFTLLLKLWRFDHQPLEHAMGNVTPVGSQLTPEFLLLARNSQLSCDNSLKNQNKNKKRKRFFTEFDDDVSSAGPVFLDSFPKLKLWYRQHQACIASTLSDLKPGTSVYKIFDALLNMMFKMTNKGGQSQGQSQTLTSTSGSSNSSGSVAEDYTLCLKLPAWEILEAVPFALDAALIACEHGSLSPRELTTGLRGLADFLPASMATIVSYLSAETTRGLWKPASMNGTDWPSPATNLTMVEQNMNKILAATGVHVPSLSAGGTSPATLPLPLAALVSLTITYTVDRSSETMLDLAGPALNTLGAGCPFPCMAIIAALWIQKAKRWTNYLVFSASRTVFRHNNDAVVQLLGVCFQSTLGLNSPPTTGGIGNLLGHGFGSHSPGGIAPVAPGILYLRVHRSLRDALFMTEEIISLLMISVKDIISTNTPTETLKKPKSGNIVRYGEVSLSTAMTRIKLAASLGASLIWITGGLTLIQTLIKETLPSWFISVNWSNPVDQNKLDSGETEMKMIGMLKGYALAYFTVLSGAFAWGVDSASLSSKKRAVILGAHLEFIAKALDGEILLGCNKSTWRAYVAGFVSLMVTCTPKWAREVDVAVLRSLSNGLRKLGEDELAVALLGIGGARAMGAGAEFIVKCSV